jgi:sensor c-di-GMP phosphodiesterase-like protein
VKLLLILAALLLFAAPLAQAQSFETRLTRLEERVRRIDSSLGFDVIAAVVCALWAQNHHRNAWLWFFVGLIFSVFALFAMLYKNSQDRAHARSRGPAAAPP